MSLVYPIQVDIEVLTREAKQPNLDVIDLAIALLQNSASLNSLRAALKISFNKCYYYSTSSLSRETATAEERYIDSVLKFVSFAAYRQECPKSKWVSVEHEENTYCFPDLNERSNKVHRIEILQEFRAECLMVGQAALLPAAPVTVTKRDQKEHLVVEAQTVVPVPNTVRSIIYSRHAIPKASLDGQDAASYIVNSFVEATECGVRELLNKHVRLHVYSIVEKGATKETGWPAVSADGRYLQLC